MGYDEFILTINVTSIIILTVMAFLLCSAARFKGESSYAALIIVLTTVPVYTYNVCRSMEWYDVALFLAPIASSVNLMLMPLLWMLTQRGFNYHYRFTPIQMLHFLPAVASSVLFCVGMFSLPESQYYDFMIHENTGNNTWLGNMNYMVLLVQIIGYFYAMFRYLRKVKHYIRDHYTVAEVKRKVWIPRFIALFAALLVIMMMCYVLWPQTDAWLLQLFNVVAMVYLLYSELDIALSSRLREVPASAVVAEAKAEFTTVMEKPKPDTDIRKDDMEQLQQYARQVEEYLRTSEVYVNPNLSLKEVAKATGVSTNNLSKSINTVLGKNFFDLVNGLRVEKSKFLLVEKKEKGLTLETIAEQCGFNSQVTYCNAFKKAIGMTTNQWLKLFKNRF